jgi:hypothetical protein
MRSWAKGVTWAHTRKAVGSRVDNGKIPFLFTLILTIIGWAVAHVVDRISTAPTIEFETSNRVRGSEKVFIVQLTNLSSDRTFRGLQLQLQAPTASKVTALYIRPVEPGFEGDEPTHVAQTGDAWFKFAELQPEGTFFAEATYTGDPPKVRISLENGTARVVAPSLETFLVRYEVKVLIGLICVGMFLLVIYWLSQRSRPRLAPAPLDVRII